MPKRIISNNKVKCPIWGSVSADSKCWNCRAGARQVTDFKCNEKYVMCEVADSLLVQKLMCYKEQPPRYVGRKICLLCTSSYLKAGNIVCALQEEFIR